MGRADTRNPLAQLSSPTSLSPVASFPSFYHLFLQPLLLYHHFFRLEAAGGYGKMAGSRGAQQVVMGDSRESWEAAGSRGPMVVVGGTRGDTRQGAAKV
jgi:hypothetical protein